MKGISQNITNQFTNINIPRSKAYKDKVIESQGYVTIKNFQYFKRLFNDGSVELVRYDFETKKWVFLCFIS